MDSQSKRAADIRSVLKRIQAWYIILLLIIGVFAVRLFYVQVIRYNYYHARALSDQLKEYQIPASRGLIEAQEGNAIVPIVLDQKLYTLYADPTLVHNSQQAAKEIAHVIGGSSNNYAKLLSTKNTRYVVLAHKLSNAQSNQILAQKLPGVGTQGQDYRTYPEGSLASQVLGFVNNSGQGEYGIEQSLNSRLAGKPGKLKAITDANGVPLAADSKNVEIKPTDGKNIVLTLNMGIQAELEGILKQEYGPTYSQGLSAMVMNPNNGAIVAMANYPTYDPANYADVSNYSLFENNNVSFQLEPGSIMKVLTTAAALNQGVIQPNTTYNDPFSVQVDGQTITEVDFPPSHTVSIGDVLRYSLNTGAVYILKQMGGGSINAQARNVWYNYMTKHYLLGKPTGIEQPNEGNGSVPGPVGGSSLDFQYANTAFGQGVSVTMLQMISAYSSVLNGGTYYQPHLVDGYMNDNGSEQKQSSKILESNVVKPSVSSDIQGLMEYVFSANHVLYKSNMHPGYSIGGKTGTAQIAVNGVYSPTEFNGTFMGFVGGADNKPQYVIAIFNKNPKLPSDEFGGAEGSAPIFGKIADMLINNGYVNPQG